MRVKDAGRRRARKEAKGSQFQKMPERLQKGRKAVKRIEMLNSLALGWQYRQILYYCCTTALQRVKQYPFHQHTRSWPKRTAPGCWDRLSSCSYPQMTSSRPGWRALCSCLSSEKSDIAKLAGFGIQADSSSFLVNQGSVGLSKPRPFLRRRKRSKHGMRVHFLDRYSGSGFRKQRK